MRTRPHQVLVDKFTLFQSGRADFAHHIGLSPPSFESHRLELELGLAVPITSSAYSLNAVTPHIKRLGKKLARKSLYPIGTSFLYDWQRLTHWFGLWLLSLDENIFINVLIFVKSDWFHKMIKKYQKSFQKYWSHLSQIHSQNLLESVWNTDELSLKFVNHLSNLLFKKIYFIPNLL